MFEIVYSEPVTMPVLTTEEALDLQARGAFPDEEPRTWRVEIWNQEIILKRNNIGIIFNFRKGFGYIVNINQDWGF